MTVNLIQMKQKAHVSPKGITGTKECYVPWSDRLDSTLPVLGDSWDIDNPYLICNGIDYDYIDANNCNITFSYSTECQLAEDFYQLNISFGTESDDSTRGWTWANAGTVVTDQINTTRPLIHYRLKMKVFTDPTSAIETAYNKVNSSSFLGTAAGYLRLIDADVDKTYDISGNFLSAQVSFVFQRRWQPHNDDFRKPRIKKKNGQDMYYQTTDSADTETYTTDATKESQPIYVSGDAGSGAWDTPEDDNGDPRYETCDFASVLGIPTT